MNHLGLTIIHLLHDMKVKPSAIFADDFVESFNLNLENPSLNEKAQQLTLLKDDSYMDLTQQGGKFWEKHFLIDWQLYFEYGSQFISDKECVFFYATRQATIKLAMKHSKGLFDDGTIQTAKNWQPIYWKKPFDGFYIQKELNSGLLPYFDDILPKYCKSLDFNAKFISFKQSCQFKTEQSNCMLNCQMSEMAKAVCTQNKVSTPTRSMRDEIFKYVCQWCV